MKNHTMLLLLAIAICGRTSLLCAFCSKTHSSVTERAVLQSLCQDHIKQQIGIREGLQYAPFLTEGLTPEPERILPQIPANANLRDYIRCGACLEDQPTVRAKHHFHDPTRNAGLDNKTDHPYYASLFAAGTYVRYWGDATFDLTGISAIDRALGGLENQYGWHDSRMYFAKALTEQLKETRGHYLALAFLSLGHASHLLEDMGVPPHTRNDFLFAHYRPPASAGNPFESWLEEQVEANDDQCPWSGTGPVVFDKLAKYFDDTKTSSLGQ